MSFNPQQELYTSAYGELLTAEKTPIVQINARYGFSSELLRPVLGGTTSFTNNMFIASTGTGANNVAAVLSSRESAQRPGQGLTFEGSAVFTQGVANSTQEAGFISSTSTIAFGYDGVNFGITIADEGQLEHQDLTVSAVTGAAGTCSITVDGVNYPAVPITGGSTTLSAAYQIATYLNTNEPRYRFFSNNGVVTALARLPDFGGGAWSFTSAVVTASWAEITNGALANETWVYQADWNEYPEIDFDPTTYNEYKIQVDANIEFYIKDNRTGNYELVHVFQHLGVNQQSLINNPTFRVGWACRNTGNTTNISVSGYFVSSFIEGKLEYTQPTFAEASSQLSVGAVKTNIVAFRNRAVYNGNPNRAEIIPRFLSFGTDAVKPIVFEIWANPTVASGQFLDWQYLDEPNSLMETATNSATITGGQLVGTFVVLSSRIVDIDKIVKFQIPTAEFAIAATGNPSTPDIYVSGTWVEDK